MILFGRKFPAHTHIGGEEFLVLEGTFKDQFGEFPAGTYVRNPIGSEHSPWVDEDGCTIMVKLLQMADTGEGLKPLHIDLAQVKQESSIEVSFGRVSELYHNVQTGEHVEMCWIDADRDIASDSRALDGGEELFVLDGHLKLSGEVFGRWDWLRFPVGTTENRKTLKAGPDGAQVYRKTGHLTEKALAMEKIQIGDDENVISS